MTESTNTLELTHSHLANVGARTISRTGFGLAPAMEHLAQHRTGRKQWCDVECMARTMYGKNTRDNVHRVRRGTSKVFRAMLERNEFLVIKYDDSRSGRGRIVSMKLYDGGDDQDKYFAGLQLERMRQRREINAASVEHAQQLLGLDQ